MLRKLLISGLLGVCALATSLSAAAPPKKPRGGKRPPSKTKKATPELSLLRLQRVDKGPIFPGNYVTIRAEVKNRSSSPARFGVLLTPTHPGARPVRSSPVRVKGHSSRRVDMKIKVDRYGVKSERFAGTIMLFDPSSTARSYIGQRWKDRNQRDNTKRLSLSVNVPNYSVSATIKKMVVSNDCGSSRWTVDVGFGSLPTGYTPRSVRDFPSLRPGFKRAHRETRGANVESGKTTSVNLKMRIPRLSKKHQLTIAWHPGFSDYNLATQELESIEVGSIIEVLKPAQWRRGGTFTFGGVLGGDGRCGTKPYTLQVYVQAIPTDEVLH